MIKRYHSDKDTIKTVSADRDKAKMAGVKERIASETASLRAENDEPLRMRLMKRLFRRISLKYITVSYLYRCLIPSSFWIM